MSLSWKSETSMEDTVDGFVAALGAHRRITMTETRPILFIAHSMGGPILQKLHVQLLFISDARGLMKAPVKALFFGAPERYFLNTESLLKSLGTTVTESLTPFVSDAAFLTNHTRDFDQLIRNEDPFQCQYFLENVYSEQAKLTDNEVRSLPAMKKVTLSKDHGSLIRYTSREEPDYRRIVVCIQAWVAGL
ncbi:hypothetical protein PQX77_003835 [Marasmius sp. AFHP31]|nr:hypothetical protein PQX77_003835 [Marasmius sp. AFHP31]